MSSTTTTTMEVAARRANRWWTGFKERAGEVAAEKLKNVSVTGKAATFHDDNNSRSDENGNNKTRVDDKLEHSIPDSQNTFTSTMAESLPENELLQLDEGHASEDQPQPEKQPSQNEEQNEIPRSQLANSKEGNQMLQGRGETDPTEVVKEGETKWEGKQAKQVKEQQKEESERGDTNGDIQPSVDDKHKTVDGRRQSSHTISDGPNDGDEIPKSDGVGGDHDESLDEDEMLRKVAEIVMDTTAVDVQIQQRKKELNDWIENGLDTSMRRKQELDALIKAKNSKARELWFKDYRARRFIPFSDYRDELMKISLPAHDTSGATLNAEAKLLRAQHHEMMVERQRDIQQRIHQDMIDHLWSFLPEIRHEKELAEMVGNNQVEKLRISKDEMIENYEAHIRVQRKIIAKFHMRELEHDALERRKNEQRNNSLQSQANDRDPQSVEDHGDQSMDEQQKLQALKIASGEIQPGTAELRGSAEKRLMERQAAAERLRARRQRQTELAKERQAKGEIITQNNLRALERVSANMETIRSVQMHLENAEDDEDDQVHTSRSRIAEGAESEDGKNTHDNIPQKGASINNHSNVAPSTTLSMGSAKDTVASGISGDDNQADKSNHNSNKSGIYSGQIDLRVAKSGNDVLDGSFKVPSANERQTEEKIDGKHKPKSADSTLENSKSSLKQDGDSGASASQLNVPNDKESSDFPALSPQSFKSSHSGSSPRNRPGTRVVTSRRNQVQPISPTPLASGVTSSIRQSSTTEGRTTTTSSAATSVQSSSPRAGRRRVFSPGSPRPSPRSPRGTLKSPRSPRGTLKSPRSPGDRKVSPRSPGDRKVSPRSPGDRKVSPRVRRGVVAATASPALDIEPSQPAPTATNSKESEAVVSSEASNSIAATTATTSTNNLVAARRADRVSGEGVKHEVGSRVRRSFTDSRRGRPSLLERAESVRTGRGSSMVDRTSARAGRGREGLLDRAESARLGRATTARVARRPLNGAGEETEGSKTASEDGAVARAGEGSREAGLRVRSSIAEGRRGRQSLLQRAESVRTGRGASMVDRSNIRRAGRGQGNLLDRAQSVRMRSSVVGGVASGSGDKTGQPSQNGTSQRTQSESDVLTESEHGPSATNPRRASLRASRVARR